jgi:hypothetical protein
MRFFFSIFLIFYVTVNIYSQNERIALIIGNENYQFTASLSNPVNDARSISQLLQKLDFKVLEYENLSQKDLKIAIDDYGEKLKQYKIGLFYYSGHGIQVDGNNYIVPVDANLKSEKDAELDCVNLGRLLSRMETSGTNTNVVILDACRNNPFSKSWERSVRNNGLAFVEAPTGSLIAYSTSPGGVASDGTGKNGLYTDALMTYLGDPDLNIIQVFQQVRKTVKDKSKGEQVPWESTSLEGDFYFNQTGDKITLTELTGQNIQNGITEKEVISKIREYKLNSELVWAEARGNSVSVAELSVDALLKHKIIDTSLYFKPVYVNSDNVTTDKILIEGKNLMMQELKPFINRKVYKKGNKYTVFKYISNNDILNYVQNNTVRIISALEIAEQSAEKNYLGNALKYYYWAYSLALAHPDISQIIPSTSNINVSQQSLLKWMGDKMQEIISSISCRIIDSVDVGIYKRYEIQFVSKDVILEDIDFKYWNGAAWSEMNCVNNGIGFIDIYKESTSNGLKVEVSCFNSDKTKFDKSLQKTASLSNVQGFSRQCTVIVKPGNIASVTLSKPEENIYINSVKEVIRKVLSKDYSFNKDIFTESGFEVFKSLLIYGDASFFKLDYEYNIIKVGNEVFLRGLPVKFSFKNNKVEFFEKLCFQFDSTSRINSISFSLGDKSLQSIMNQTRWPSETKFKLISFLENYKTAYALKRYDYINKIFSENALIIVGERIVETEKIDDNKFVMIGDKYKLIKLSKEQYLYRLKKVFDSNEFINLQFEEAEVKKRDNQTAVFGINIRQNYYSATYADQGYLFLMADFADTKRPVIYVRSWQQEKFNNDQIITLSDFSY